MKDKKVYSIIVGVMLVTLVVAALPTQAATELNIVEKILKSDLLKIRVQVPNIRKAMKKRSQTTVMGGSS